VREQDQRKFLRFGADRHGEIRDQLQPVAGLDDDRLALGELILLQLGSVGEEKVERLAGAVVDVIRQRSVINGVVNDPYPVRVIPADHAISAGVSRLQKVHVLLDARIDHQPFRLQVIEFHSLYDAGVGMNLHRADVHALVLGDDLEFLAGHEVDAHEARFIRTEGRGRVEGPAIGGEIYGTAVFAERPGDEIAPRFAGAIAHPQRLAAVGVALGHGAANLEVRVGEPAQHVPGVLGVQHDRAGHQIDAIHIEHAAVAQVQSHENFVGMVAVGNDVGGADALKRRQIPDHLRLQIGGVDVPVFIPAAVLQVDQVPAVLGPELDADPPVRVVGDHGVVILTDRSHPNVQHPCFGRGDAGEHRSVRRDPGPAM
jgi:hypothetical protein